MSDFWPSNKKKKFSWEENTETREERRKRVNGEDPIKHPRCDCGAKHDKDFPNVHSRWCAVYWSGQNG